MRNCKLGMSIIFTIVALIAFSACGKEALSHKGDDVIPKDNDEFAFKIENTKSIDIYDIVSSDSNNNVSITDPEIIEQLERLFNETTYVESTNPILTTSLYIKFCNDVNNISFFIYANDVVDIEGKKYKSSDAIFDEINRLYEMHY